MPKPDAARSAQPTYAAPLCLLAAIGAFLFLSISEVFPVYFPVAIFANRLAVGNVKPKLRELSPRLDMVCVKLTAASIAIVASEIISLENGAPPNADFRCEQFSLRLRHAALPSPVEWAFPQSWSASTRAKSSFFVGRNEWRLTSFAELFNWWVANRPACLRAIPGCWHSVCVNQEFLPANSTGICGLMYICHDSILDKSRNKSIAPQYVDVAVRRWCEFTGQDATREADGLTFTDAYNERNSK